MRLPSATSSPVPVTPAHAAARTWSYDAQFSPDGKRVAEHHRERRRARSGDLDEPARPEHRSKGIREHQNGLDYAADGRLATAGGDGTVRVWPAREGPAIVMRGHTRRSRASPSGPTAARC